MGKDVSEWSQVSGAQTDFLLLTMANPEKAGKCFRTFANLLKEQKLRPRQESFAPAKNAPARFALQWMVVLVR